MEKTPNQIRRLKGSLALVAIAFALLVLAGGPDPGTGDRGLADNPAVTARPAWNG